MITQDAFTKLAIQYQTTEFPNIVREYCQHLFLSKFYALEGAENILFKGGTALRIIYGSPRFSEDLDFSLFNVAVHERQKLIEDSFAKTLSEISLSGIKVELGPKPGITSEGYYGEATFAMYDYPPAVIEINISNRNGRTIRGEIESIANNFLATYNLFHLPQVDLVDEKITAMFDRKKARDFYDLYFMMRKNILTNEHKQRLVEHRAEIAQYLESIDFRGELGVFLPKDQQGIIRDFNTILMSELQRQLGLT